MSKHDEIEKLFRERFNKQEAPVSDRVWEGIKKTLPPEKPEGTGYTMPLIFSVALLVVLTGLFIGLRTYNDGQTEMISGSDKESDHLVFAKESNPLDNSNENTIQNDTEKEILNDENKGLDKTEPGKNDIDGIPR